MQRDNTSTIDAEVRRMLDEREITAVLLRYMRGVDRCDRDAIQSAFHSDAVTHHGSFGAGGPSEFADYVVSTAMPRYHRTMHYISNMAFEFVDDTAYVETYLKAAHMRTAEENTIIEWFGGRFIDRWERRDGAWKIAERTVVREWDDSQTSSSIVAWRGKFLQSARDKSDPVYARLVQR